MLWPCHGKGNKNLKNNVKERGWSGVGLARTCEVFCAEALVVADLRVLKDPEFRVISVTAEQWVPVLEVSLCRYNCPHTWSRERWVAYTLPSLTVQVQGYYARTEVPSAHQVCAHRRAVPIGVP